jgi:hypothetical protein
MSDLARKVEHDLSDAVLLAALDAHGAELARPSLTGARRQELLEAVDAIQKLLSPPRVDHAPTMKPN